MWVIFVTIPGISPSAFGAFLRGSGQMAPWPRGCRRRRSVSRRSNNMTRRQVGGLAVDSGAMNMT